MLDEADRLLELGFAEEVCEIATGVFSFLASFTLLVITAGQATCQSVPARQADNAFLRHHDNKVASIFVLFLSAVFS